MGSNVDVTIVKNIYCRFQRPDQSSVPSLIVRAAVHSVGAGRVVFVSRGFVVACPAVVAKPDAVAVRPAVPPPVRPPLRASVGMR